MQKNFYNICNNNKKYSIVTFSWLWIKLVTTGHQNISRQVADNFVQD